MSKQVKQLTMDNDNLLELSSWFSNWAVKDQIRVAAYYEMDKTGPIHFVKKNTANPNVLGCEPTAIKANHIDICKPDTRESQLYTSVKAMLNQMAPDASALKGVVAIPKSTALAVIAPPTTGAATVPVFATGPATSLTLSGPAPSLAAKVEEVLSPELATDYEYFTTTAPHDR
jgi:hypothetical protein